jgi:predicted ATPase/DNA-binding SARP family transcriptional activator
MLVHTWDIKMLGGLALSRQEVCITHFPTEKVGLLLAYLAAYPGAQRREALTNRFWPESELEAGRASLRQALASIRRLLEPPDVPPGTVLTADRTGVALNPAAICTDLAAWDRARKQARGAPTQPERVRLLEQAIGNYGGEFLPGTYADWALEERRRRQDQYLDVLLSLSSALEDVGDVARACEAVMKALHTEPLHEEAHSRLMRLFALQGDVGRARRHYERYSRLLREELHREPDEPLRMLYRVLDTIASASPYSGPQIHPNILPSAVSPEATPVDPDPVLRARLPVHMTRFFGRAAEKGQLRDWLNSSEVRMITLTGIGGVGKSRTAIEAALETRFQHAVTFVALADIYDPELLLPAVLQALCVPALALADPIQRIAYMLGDGPHLLILDNLEQIVEPAADIVLNLLEQIPSLVCLATSRQALNLPGELELPLAPLPIPDSTIPHELVANPTVQLLVDRMRARRPDFQVTPANAETVAQLCARLEGIPLAVELIAGWARDLTPSQMLDRLARRFELLVSRQRGVPSRHQSLRAAVESSYHLISPELQRFFLRLSVFRGGWREEMAEVALDPDDDAGGTRIERLRRLQEHSLIAGRVIHEHIRYSMLDTLRAFGQETLTVEDAESVRMRYAAWLLEFAREANAMLHGAEQTLWLDRLEEEQENFRNALEFLADNDPATGLQLTNALYWFWYMRGYYREGEQFLMALLARSPHHLILDRAWGLLAAGHLANCQSNNAAAAERYEQALALFETAGDLRGQAHAICRLGNAAQEMMDLTTARRLCAEGVKCFRTLDDPPGLLLSLFYYGNTLDDSADADVERGRAVFQEGLALAEALGNVRFQSLFQHCLCHIFPESGSVDSLVEGYRKTLRLQRMLREPLPLSYTMRELASLLAKTGFYAPAARLLGAMKGLRKRIGYLPAQHEQKMLSKLDDEIGSGLTADEYHTNVQAGQALDFAQCLALACDVAENL